MENFTHEEDCMKNLFRLFLLSLAMLMLLSGCQTTAPDRISTLEDFFAPPSDKVFSTADNIVIRGIRSNYNKEGHLRVDFKLYNNRGRRNVVNYRVQWLNNDGMVTGTYGPWDTTALEGQQEIIVRTISPSKHAVDYKLELQSN
jgi:uncharacterized protein YcfL